MVSHMLEHDIREQLTQYLTLLEQNICLKVCVSDDKLSKELETFVNEVASLSSKISVEKTSLERTPSFSVNRIGEDTGVVFAGLPLGHEFTSLVLALLQVSGRPPKIEQNLIDQIRKINHPLHFTSYISLTCHNCPDVVQALNTMSVLNPNIKHTMVNGSDFKEEIAEKEILAVPTVMLNKEHFGSGRMSLEEILSKIGIDHSNQFKDKKPFDVLIIGGGPAGASAAIYAARKGIRTGLLAERMGGQVLDTMSIENLIGIKQTDGPKLSADLENHIKEYDVDLMKNIKVKSIKKEKQIQVELENGTILSSKTLIIATGARWRNINVPGEQAFKNKGVAYCPHCDGPLFKHKNVAVIGGGNSGIEAAIDLAGIVNHVTVLEYLGELKADKVLQEKLFSLPNVTVMTNAQTKEITGTEKVNGITYIDRTTNQEHHISLEGVFIQIGLIPNTEWIQGFIETNKFGEIIVDAKNATNIPGVFAAGDCTTSPYKQIIISMGSGATAALSAFDYLIRTHD